MPQCLALRHGEGYETVEEKRKSDLRNVGVITFNFLYFISRYSNKNYKIFLTLNLSYYSVTLDIIHKLNDLGNNHFLIANPGFLVIDLLLKSKM